MDTQTIELGTTVKWTSQAGGITRTKKGHVVEVVPAQQRPKTKQKDLGSPRDHESYMVRASVIDGSEKQKKHSRVYWPTASRLRVV